MTIGVEVTTSTRTGPSNTGALSGRLHVAGLTERGPIGHGVVVQSLNQFEATFGGRTPYASNVIDTLRTFWEEGGSEAIVSRVVGPAPVRGQIILKDTAGIDTVKLEATQPGAFSTTLAAQVDVVDTTLTLTLFDGDEVLGVYRGLDSPADFVDALRTNAAVRATDLLSVTVAPENLPVASPRASLSEGSDDRASVTAVHVGAALDAAGELGAGGAVAAPGYPADVVGGVLIEHARASGKIALLAAEEDSTRAQVLEMALDLTRTGGEYAGIFWPHLVIPDGSGTRTISPEGYVAAVRARAHVDTGFWQAPPGDRARTQFVLGTVVPVNTDENNLLADGLVNGIVTTGTKVRLYNWASLSDNRESYALLSTRDLLNSLTVRLKDAFEPYVWSTVDGKQHLLSHIESAAVAELEPVARAGGFFALEREGEEIDPGYQVVVDATLNTPGSLAKNQVLVSVSVRPSPMAALIKVDIIKVDVTAAL